MTARGGLLSMEMRGGEMPGGEMPGGEGRSEISILLLEDSEQDAELLVAGLELAGLSFRTQRVDTPEAYVAALDEGPDLVIADYSLPRYTALEALKVLLSRRDDVPFIVVTGSQGEERAVECMREGATDYLLKDRLARLGSSVQRALDERRLRREKREAELELRRMKDRLQDENAYLKAELQSSAGAIIGSSPALRDTLELAERVAPVSCTVLLFGETGTGKELFARAIHDMSPRRDRALVRVNCAALPPTLIESELFGHVKGAFTSAVARQTGRFELAHRGTLFLDEIGELPLSAQGKLLRVLQEQEFEPIGSEKTVKVDVRVIAATNRDLEEASRRGEFRSDLYYRLAVFPIRLPPLRERPLDIPDLIRAFAKRFAAQLGRPMPVIDEAVFARARRYEWPGNVRELEHVVERAMILHRDGVLRLDLDGPDTRPTRVSEPARAEPAAARGSEPALPDAGTLEDVERAHVLRILERTQWTIGGNAGAAALLGLKPSTLRSLMQRLGIQRPA